MYDSPCLNHKECDLDLNKLREALKSPRFADPEELERLQARIDSANKRLNNAYKVAREAQSGLVGSIKSAVGMITGAPDYRDHPDYKAALAERDAARTEKFTCLRKSSKLYWTLLYSIRAHHRGKVHMKRVRQDDGSFIEHTLESQRQFIEQSGWDLLNRFRKQ